jgi:hypothetical protein
MGTDCRALVRRSAVCLPDVVEHRRCFGAGQEAEGAARVRGRKLVARAPFCGRPFNLEKRGLRVDQEFGEMRKASFANCDEPRWSGWAAASTVVPHPGCRRARRCRPTTPLGAAGFLGREEPRRGRTRGFSTSTCPTWTGYELLSVMRGRADVHDVRAVAVTPLGFGRDRNGAFAAGFEAI